MGQQRLSFLFLMSTENDIVETLTVACREKGERGDVLRHPRQRVIKRMKFQKVFFRLSEFFFYPLLARPDIGAGVEQPFGCLIVQNRQAV